MTSREFPDPDHILLPNDHRLIYVPATTWECPLCFPKGVSGSYTTVEWLGSGNGPDGRCSQCGVKIVLARPGESVPSPEEQR